ncbi:MAG: serine/threonine-protein kinase [Polyangiaceae bacterium]
MNYRTADLQAALGHRFTSFKLLGQGGEGAVFAVYDRERKEDIALKITIDTGEVGLAERFETEYRILAATRSDRLVRVYNRDRAMVRAADGNMYPHFWFSMEKCDSSVRRSYQQMTLRDRLTIVLQMLDGLALLHAKNIAHRDIKPDNLFLVGSSRGPSVKIGDFGIATTTRFAPNSHNGRIHGSPAYLAPERWLNSEDADWRPADQYAAGITMYELLSNGEMPLDFTAPPGTAPELASIAAFKTGHQTSAVRPLRIPERRGRPVRSVNPVLAQMLAKRPGWRHADVAECKRELENALLMDGLSS